MARRRLRQALAVLFVATGGLPGAACGGSPPPGVANLGSTTATTLRSSQTARSGGDTASNYRAALAYVDCMRSHGVSKFPDPTNADVVRLIGVDQNSPQYKSAQDACEALVPGADSK